MRRIIIIALAGLLPAGPADAGKAADILAHISVFGDQSDPSAERRRVEQEIADAKLCKEWAEVFPTDRPIWEDRDFCMIRLGYGRKDGDQ